jgi:hypothetical protein
LISHFIYLLTLNSLLAANSLLDLP